MTLVVFHWFVVSCPVGVFQAGDFPTLLKWPVVCLIIIIAMDGLSLITGALSTVGASCLPGMVFITHGEASLERARNGQYVFSRCYGVRKKEI